jgi:signal transduction histidine kinase
MNTHFQELSIKYELLRTRYLFISAAISSFIFYAFMQKIQVGSIDSLTFRVVLSVVCLFGAATTFYKSKYQSQLIVFSYYMGRIGWLALYLYLLQVNHWTLYQRWSYFVLVFILCGTAYSWRDYLEVTLVSIISPIILGLFSNEISTLEEVHFHIANVVPLFIIGVTIRSHYRFKTEVELLTKSLVEKSQLTVLGEVAAGVSHEVNSPLMIFSYSLHQLKRQLAHESMDKEKITILINKMYRMIERISNIVNALKVYSGRTDDKFEEVNLINLLEESLTLCNRKFIDQGITIIRKGNESEILCMAKKSQIIQCFLNLFTNAIEACQNLPTPQIEITTNITNTHAFIAISDNGPGVSDEFSAKIMHPFFTTKEIASGLGLSVSQGIARGHDGDLFLDRSISSSTFVLKLPLTSL